MNKNFVKSILITIMLCGLFFASAVSAATLYISPSSGNFKVGDRFSVGIYVNSSDQAMNAASGVLNFSTDNLEVVSVAKSALFSTWVQEPGFSNGVGTVNFEGVVFNPGFTGKAGKIMQITFRAKKAGSGKMAFSAASVLANDGSGTEIFSGSGGGTYNINVAKVVEPSKPVMKPVEPTKTPETTKKDLPGKPQIFSAIPPELDAWSNTNTLKLAWSGEAGIQAIKFSFDSKYSDPSTVITPAVYSFEKNDLADGVYVFSLRFKNAGGWGPISTYDFRVDTVAPENFVVSLVNGANQTFELNPKIKFSLKDSLSGIKSYKVNIDNNYTSEEVKVGGNDDYIYIMPLQKFGQKHVTVTAVDKAGNMTSSSFDFVIKELKSPLFTDYPNQISPRENLVVAGISEPNAKVKVYWQLNGDKKRSRVVLADEAGKFVFATGEKNGKGIYRLWAEVIRDDGTKSDPGSPILIQVSESYLLEIGRNILDYAIVYAPLAGIVILVDLFLWLAYNRMIAYRRRRK